MPLLNIHLPYLLSQAKPVSSVKKGKQTAILLTESLPRLAFLQAKDSVYATNQLDTEEIRDQY